MIDQKVIFDKGCLKQLIIDNGSNGMYSRESVWIRNFSTFYNELQIWTFPDNFKFTQKVYHYINDDPELKLGICPECGKRCKFKNILKGYRTYCSIKCAANSDSFKNKHEQFFIATYGCKNPSQSEIIKKKKEQTNLKRRGVKYAFQSEEVKEKSKQTCLEKYGCEYSFQSEEVRKKYKQTCLEKYGEDHPSKVDSIKYKKEQTCLSNYGVENPSQSEEVKKKKRQTYLDRYGKEHYSQTDEFKNKFKDTEWVKSIQEKSYNTKKKNNSFHISKIEEQIKQYLDKNNIPYIYQYTSERYPFNCDFYFPDRDLYVEIQGTWTHGPHPFTNSEEDKLLLEKWRSKNTDYYNAAIKTWTIMDVRKRETARQNNLNYLEVFSCDLDECINFVLDNI